jgi:uncharacterized SAM-binding protein YcdF (DUF218 family)
MPSPTRTAQQPRARGRTCTHVSPADAIIVLGGGVRRDGALTTVSRARVESALELYRAGVAPRFIMTGKCGLFRKKPVSEALAMAEFARTHNVPEGHILIEDHARDTLGNACHTRDRYLAPARWRRLHIVTSDFHRKRAETLFRAALGSGYTCEFTMVASGFTRAELALRLWEPLKPVRLALLQRSWTGDLHARKSAPAEIEAISTNGAP